MGAVKCGASRDTAAPSYLITTANTAYIQLQETGET